MHKMQKTPCNVLLYFPYLWLLLPRIIMGIVGIRSASQEAGNSNNVSAYGKRHQATNKKDKNDKCGLKHGN